MAKTNFKTLTIFLFLFILLFNLNVFGEDSIKIKDTIYTEKLSSKPIIITELDSTDKIEFSVADSRYTLDVASLSPHLIELKLMETGDIIKVPTYKQEEVILPDNSKLFVEYLEYVTLKVPNAKISLWAEISGEPPAVVEEQSQNLSKVQESSTQINNIAEPKVEEIQAPATTSQTKKYGLTIFLIVVLIVSIALVVYFVRKRKKKL